MLHHTRVVCSRCFLRRRRWLVLCVRTSMHPCIQWSFLVVEGLDCWWRLECCNASAKNPSNNAFPFWPQCVLPLPPSSSPHSPSPHTLQFPSHFPAIGFSPFTSPTSPYPLPFPSSLLPSPLPSCPCIGAGGVPVCNSPVGGEFHSTNLQWVPAVTQGEPTATNAPHGMCSECIFLVSSHTLW